MRDVCIVWAKYTYKVPENFISELLHGNFISWFGISTFFRHYVNISK